MGWVQTRMLVWALLFHVSVLGADSIVLTTSERDVEKAGLRLPSVPLAATSLRVQVSMNRQTPEEKADADTEKTLMEKINSIGRDLCKERPNHPKCQQFKDKPKPAQEAMVPAPAPHPAPEANAPPLAPAPEASDLDAFGEAGPNVSPAPSPPVVKTPPFGKLDSWGTPSRTNPTMLPPVEGGPEETSQTTVFPPPEPPAKSTEWKNWGEAVLPDEKTKEKTTATAEPEAPVVTAEPEAQVTPTTAPAVEPEAPMIPTEAPLIPTDAPAKVFAEAAARQQAVAEVASSRPAQLPARETASAPTSPPRKITPEQRAAKLP